MVMLVCEEWYWLFILSTPFFTEFPNLVVCCLLHQVTPIGNIYASPFCDVPRILLPTSKILVLCLLCRSYRALEGFQATTQKETWSLYITLSMYLQHLQPIKKSCRMLPYESPHLTCNTWTMYIIYTSYIYIYIPCYLPHFLHVKIFHCNGICAL